MRTRKASAVLNRSTAEYRAELELWKNLRSSARTLAACCGMSCTLYDAIQDANQVIKAVKTDIKKSEAIEKELEAIFADEFNDNQQLAPKTDAA